LVTTLAFCTRVAILAGQIHDGLSDTDALVIAASHDTPPEELLRRKRALRARLRGSLDTLPFHTEETRARRKLLPIACTIRALETLHADITTIGLDRVLAPNITGIYVTARGVARIYVTACGIARDVAGLRVVLRSVS